MKKTICTKILSMVLAVALVMATTWVLAPVGVKAGTDEESA